MPLTTAAQSGFKGSAAPPITSTGMRGFLQWYQREQPGLYPVVAAKIQATVPQVFSVYNQGAVQAAKSLSGLASLERRYSNNGRIPRAMTRLHGLGDCGFCVCAEVASGLECIGTGAACIAAAGSSGMNATISVCPSTANQGTGSTTSTNAVAGIIAGATALAVTGAQLSTANSITQLQLQRAQEGLSPLNISMGANGIPIISGTSLSSTSLLFILGAGLLLLVLMGSKKSV